jgi:hypothetical protein
MKTFSSISGTECWGKIIDTRWSSAAPYQTIHRQQQQQKQRQSLQSEIIWGRLKTKPNLKVTIHRRILKKKSYFNWREHHHLSSYNTLIHTDAHILPNTTIRILLPQETWDQLLNFAQLYLLYQQQLWNSALFPSSLILLSQFCSLSPLCLFCYTLLQTYQAKSSCYHHFTPLQNQKNQERNIYHAKEVACYTALEEGKLPITAESPSYIKFIFSSLKFTHQPGTLAIFWGKTFSTAVYNKFFLRKNCPPKPPLALI